MQEIILLFKQFYVIKPEDNLNTQTVLGSNEKQFPEATNLFNSKLTLQIFKLFETSVNEWRCYEACLNFFDKCVTMIPRKEIRTKYIPNMT
jgi:hypothetical protein